MKDLMAQYTSMQTANAEGTQTASNEDAIDTDFSAEK